MLDGAARAGDDCRAAKLTGKTAYNTYPLVRQFSELGLVQTEQDAQSKKPELAYDGIVLELVLT